MQLTIAQILGVVVIVLGLRFLARGIAAKSTPRIVNGIAILLVGVAQFFPPKSFVATTLLALGLVLFVSNLVALKRAGGRIVRPRERRR